MSNQNSLTITNNENDKENDDIASNSSPSPSTSSSSSAVTKKPTSQKYFFNNSNSIRLVGLDNYSTDNNQAYEGDKNRNSITNSDVNSSRIETGGGGGGSGVVGNGEINVLCTDNSTNGHENNSQQRIASPSPSSTDGVDNPEQITPFSLKHFLKRDNSVGTSGSNCNSGSNSTKMTGARPKVPLNIGNISSSISGTSSGGGLSSTSNSADSIKMKRSPRFSSFDSQASLAEFSYASSSTSLPIDSITNDDDDDEEDHHHNHHHYHHRHRNQYNYRHNCSNSNTRGGNGSGSGRSGVGIGGGGSGGDCDNITNTNGETNDYLYLKDDKSGFQRSFSTYDISGRRYPTISHTTPNLQRIQDDDLDMISATSPVSSSPTVIGIGTKNSLPDAICPLLNNDDMMVPAEFSSALPDFVKDHIVVENYYKNAISKSSSSLINQHHQQDIKLPDFTLNETNNMANNSDAGASVGVCGGDHNIPFDLMCNSVEPSGRQSACSDGNRLDPPKNSPLMILPLDLPNVSSTSGDSYDRESIRHDSDILMNDNMPLDLTDQAYPHQLSSSSPSPYRISSIRYSNGGSGGGDCDAMGRHIADSSSGNNSGSSGLPQLSSIDSTFQTLPDFLSDGHIHQSSSTAAAGIRHHHHHQHHHDVQSIPSSSSSLSNNQTSNRSLNSLGQENIRLREELIHSHIIMTQQTVRISELESKLDLLNYHQRNCNNLPQTQQRTYKTNTFYNNGAAGDSNTTTTIPTTNQIDLNNRNLDKNKVINDLQEQIKQLTKQVEMLRQENAILKQDGAIGGSDTAPIPDGSDGGGATSLCHPSITIPITTSTIPEHVIIQSQELSRDMMLAATTAENNLRQLLSGVENLRLMARRIDNMVDSGSNGGASGGTVSVGENMSSPPSSSAPISPSSRLAHEIFSSDGEYDDFNCPRRNL